MLTVAETWAVLDSLATPLPSERVPLEFAQGRILRETIVAPEDMPALDRSAIDGYVAPLATAAGATLRIAAEIPMGQPPPAAPAPGEALKLFTGSAVPAGEVGLLMWEDTTRSADGASITLRRAPSPDLIRRRASQCAAGTELLAPGVPLNAGALALLASIGQVTPLVARRPRVAHLVTGGEIVSAEAVPASGQIRDSNSTLLAALLSSAGAERVAHARAGEAYAATAAAFATLLASPADLILVSGGSSGGEHDHAARLFADHGFTLAVNQVASRPGKPLLVATRGTRIAIGLPGNPLSHFVCFHLFVARILARLAGSEPSPLLHLPLAAGAPLRANPRETWWPATRSSAGYAPLPWADSSDLTTLARTHALLRVPSSNAPCDIADGILV
jgi:molybdopterin molybdotransferase